MSQTTISTRWGIAIILVVALYLVAAVSGIPGVDVPVFLVIGWAMYLARVTKQVHVRWDLAVSAIVYIAILVAGVHWFLLWLYAHWGEPTAEARKWRFRWTVGSLTVVALLFISGVAFTGIVHQVNWLVRSPEPMFGRTDMRERANRVKCASNLRQIGQALKLYQQDFPGPYPDDIRPLILKCDLNPEVFVCPSSLDERGTGQTLAEAAENALKPGHCSYIYLGKGLVPPIDPDRVIAVERWDNHEGEGINVLYGDGHVDWLAKKGAADLLIKLGLAKPPATQPH